MRHSGVGLEGAALERFNQIALELAELSTKFSNAQRLPPPPAWEVELAFHQFLAYPHVNTQALQLRISFWWVAAHSTMSTPPFIKPQNHHQGYWSAIFRSQYFLRLFFFQFHPIFGDPKFQRFTFFFYILPPTFFQAIAQTNCSATTQWKLQTALCWGAPPPDR